MFGNNGHLGNQMFQLASLRGIANKKGLNWNIPPVKMFGTINEIRSSIDDCFELNLSDENIGYNPFVPTIQETTTAYDESFINSVSDGTSIYGYFQTERYFTDIENSIREMYSFKDGVVSAAEDIDVPENFCSLHVRRTDYVEKSLYHTNLTKKYYSKALDIIGPENVVVFSDDPEWCREHSVYKEFLVVSSNPYVEMYLMTKASSHIIANSTFSWWGAWLSKSGGTVVYPSNWYGVANSHLDTNDICPEDWIRI